MVQVFAIVGRRIPNIPGEPTQAEAEKAALKLRDFILEFEAKYRTGTMQVDDWTDNNMSSFHSGIAHNDVTVKKDRSGRYTLSAPYYDSNGNRGAEAGAEGTDPMALSLSKALRANGRLAAFKGYELDAYRVH